ncbi:carboxylesterase/lipase family protein [Rouxiella badensis]|uniref:carboxylesterase/lipase family protein n=1 Tax=Rouxiella badensis TaxID=1646377 RepID=UPI00301C1B86
MPDEHTPLVTTDAGTVAGEWDGGIANFRGIPFAAPPVGPLRWRAPQPPEKWQGIKETNRFGQSSWQNREYCVAVGGGDPGTFSEDCLYLNVWTASPVADGKKPVMVWIHGGGYTIGSGGLSPYIGAPLASRGVVLVTLNYRLGHLGFFAHPALDAEYAAGEGVNNFALLDQIAALQWVQNNIAAFGGDPDNVTIFGESSGARSVLSLFASPLAKGLFHKGIVQSAYTLPDTTRHKALHRGKALAQHFGLTQATAEQLRELPAESFWPLSGKLGVAPVPIAGDSVLPQPMIETFNAGKQHPLPLIIGSNSDEASVLSYFNIDVAGVVTRLKKEHPLGLRLIKWLYPGVKSSQELGRQISRDMAFTTMGYVAMLGQHKAGAPGWRYYFDYVSENARALCPHGTWHGSEIPYVMNNMHLIDDAQILGGGFTPQDRAFADVVSEYWLNFARHTAVQSTHIDGDIHWPAWKPRGDKTLRFGHQGHVGLKVEQRFMRMRLRLFRLLMNKLVSLE